MIGMGLKLLGYRILFFRQIQLLGLIKQWNRKEKIQSSLFVYFIVQILSYGSNDEHTVTCHLKF